jgi:hypothetical protein
MRRALIAAGIMLSTASFVSATPLTSIAPELNYTPIERVQAAQPKKEETVTQKVKRTWRNWTTPSHSFCVRCPIPIPLTAKVCTAKGKTVEEARSVCVQQNPLCYVQAGKC